MLNANELIEKIKQESETGGYMPEEEDDEEEWGGDSEEAFLSKLHPDPKTKEEKRRLGGIDGQTVAHPYEPSEDSKKLRDRYTINNAESVVDPHQSCGCIKCRKLFHAGLIEKTKKTGKDGVTALCPFCGTPTVVISPKGGSFPAGLVHRLWTEFYASR